MVTCIYRNPKDCSCLTIDTDVLKKWTCSNCLKRTEHIESTLLCLYLSTKMLCLIRKQSNGFCLGQNVFELVDRFCQDNIISIVINQQVMFGWKCKGDSAGKRLRF